MLRKENAAYLDRLISDTILKTGYQVRSGVLRASDFGDPQNRSRVILYFAKPGIQLPEFPKATHGAVTEDHPFAVPPGKTPQKPAVKGRQATQAAAMTPHQSMPLKPFRTARDAIGYLEKIFPESGSGLVLVDGKLWTDHGIEGTYTKQGSDVLKADEAARTVRTTKGVRHYSLPRNLTVRELAELQSFPKDFQFCGSLTEKRKQIGNAVPIQFGKALAGAITYLCYPLAPCKQNA
jgi:DNA (cytosine-5)-methyltransferase 1